MTRHFLFFILVFSSVVATARDFSSRKAIGGHYPAIRELKVGMQVSSSGHDGEKYVLPQAIHPSSQDAPVFMIMSPDFGCRSFLFPVRVSMKAVQEAVGGSYLLHLFPSHFFW